MIPRTFPQDENGYMKVREVTDTTGLQEWVDYIPVQAVSDAGTTAENKYDNDGHMQVKRS